MTIKGKVFVLGDNIDTDQIIPANYLTLVPTIAEEYKKLGSLALVGLPNPATPFIVEGEYKSKYSIIIAGKNFGCGSSREHAPIALGAAGTEAIIAESFARIFFRNSIATGELYPIECKQSLVELFTTGDEAEINLDQNIVKNFTNGQSYQLSPLGDTREVIEAGGIFSYARKSGMI